MRPAEKNAGHYDQLLADGDGVLTPIETDYAKHVYPIYAVRVKNRDALFRASAEKYIFCGIHYPTPVHLQKAYLNLGYKNSDFKVSEKIASEMLSLPMYPELTYVQQEKVNDTLQLFLLNSQGRNNDR